MGRVVAGRGKELPEGLAALDVLLADSELLWPLVERWQREFHETGRLVLTEGRPTIALETYIRLMMLKQRYRWGYDGSSAQVSARGEILGVSRPDDD